jgi:hypothetical protein
MWQLKCDAEDEVCVAGLDDSTGASASEARANGRHEGWVRVRVGARLLDLCPQHARVYLARNEVSDERA